MTKFLCTRTTLRQRPHIVCLVRGASDPRECAALPMCGNRKPKWASVSAEFGRGVSIDARQKAWFLPGRLMKESIRQRLEKMTDRFEEVGRLLATAEIAGGSQQFRDLSMEYARLQPLADGYRGYHNLERDLVAAQEMLSDSDPEMRTMGAEEVNRVGQDIAAAEADLRKLLIPKDPRDDKNIFLEIRAGTGGDEAAIFAGDLFRMYSRYAED